MAVLLLSGAPAASHAQAGHAATDTSLVASPGTAFYYGIALGARSGLYHRFGPAPDADPRRVVRVGVSPTGALLFDYRDRLQQLTPAFGLSVHTRLSGVDQVRYHGLGNLATNDRPGEFYGVERYQFVLEPAVEVRPSPRVRLSAGPVLKYSMTDAGIDDGPVHVIGDPLPAHLRGVDEDDFEQVGLIQLSRPYGIELFGQAGFRAELALAASATPAPMRDLRLEVGASAFPTALDVTAPFGELHASVGGLYTAPLLGSPLLAVSVGAKKVWGDAPFHEAAYLGGSSLRSFSKHRFAGDAAVFASSEIRITVGHTTVWKPFRYGLLGLLGAGRVYVDGVSAGGWHSAAGGGVWVTPLDDTASTISLAFARSEEGVRLHVRMGLPY